MARWPTAPFSTRRTGAYGSKRLSPDDGSCGVKGYPCTHWGVDTFTDGLRDVWAPEDGVVVAVSDGNSPPFAGFGPGVVMIKGRSGYYHLLSHLERGSIRVSNGQAVGEGDSIGRFDAKFGHMHYEVRKQKTGPSETNTVNPEQWLRSQGGGLGKVLLIVGLIALGVLASRQGRGSWLTPA